MRRSSFVVTIAILAGCLSSTGCHRGGGSFLLNALTGQKPVSIALVSEQLLNINPFGPYERLRKALKEQLKRPVRLQLCLPFQLEFYLQTGSCQFAFVPLTTYARLSDRQRFPVLAVSADMDGRVERPALLLVKLDSKIQSVSELRDTAVAFGPSIDGRTYVAALEFLRRQGLTRDDLKKELLPLPGSLKHLADGHAVARSVLSGSSSAGFIDEADWDPMTAMFDRGALRILARTHPTADFLLIASPKTEPVLLEEVRSFMLSADKLQPGAMRPLALSGYRSVSEAALTGWVESLGTDPKR